MSRTLPAAITDTLPPDDRMRIGVVSQTAPLMVNVQGGDVITPGVLNYANFAVGDTVALLRQDQSWLVQGVIAPGDMTLATGQASFAGSIGADTTIFPAYTELGVNLTAPWFKRLDSTKVRVDLSMSCYSTVASTAVEVLLQLINGVTNPGIGISKLFFFNLANTHMNFGLHTLADGIAAGEYYARVIWRRPSGTGTITTDANDYVSYIVSEVN